MKALGLLAIVALATGCGSSKEPAYYALSSRAAAARPGAPSLIEIRRPGVPGYLDRADVVKRFADYRLNVDSDERWGEPLGDMIGRVLADDLSSRLTGSQVFAESGAISLAPEAIVAVNVLRFDAANDGMVTLVAEAAIEVPHSPSQTKVQRFTHQAKPAGGDTSALVGAMSGLLGDLADDLAGLLVAR